MGQCTYCYPDPQKNQNCIKIKDNIRVKFQVLPENKIINNQQTIVVLREWTAADQESQLISSNIMISDVQGYYGRYTEVSIRFKADPDNNTKIFQDYFQFRQEMEKMLQELRRQIKQEQLTYKKIIIRFDDEFLKDLSFGQAQEQKINLLTRIINQFFCLQPFKSCEIVIVVCININRHNRRKKAVDMCQDLKKNNLEDTEKMLKRLQKQKQQQLKKQLQQEEQAKIQFAKFESKNSLSNASVNEVFSPIKFMFGTKTMTDSKLSTLVTKI